MPKIDSKAADVKDFAPVPIGQYLCEVIEIEPSETQDNDEMWKMKLEIVEGDEAGKLLFDNIVFSKKAMPRAKLIASRFGLDVSKDLDLEEDMLIGKRALVTVDRIEEYQNKQNETRHSARIGFAGYDLAEQAEKVKAPTKTKEKPKAKKKKKF